MTQLNKNYFKRDRKLNLKQVKYLLILLQFLNSFCFSQDRPKPSLYTVSSDLLNIRLGPGTQYDILKTLNKGDSLYLTTLLTNGWALVSSQDRIAGFVKSEMIEKHNPYKSWEKLRLITGDTLACYNVIPSYDRNLRTKLTVRVLEGYDAVVKLYKKEESNDMCIRIAYIRSGESFDFLFIPEGLYYVKIAYGEDFRKGIVNNKCVTIFTKNSHYEIGTQFFDFYLVRKYDVIQTPTWTLEVKSRRPPLPGEVFTVKEITEEDFND